MHIVFRVSILTIFKKKGSIFFKSPKTCLRSQRLFNTKVEKGAESLQDPHLGCVLLLVIGYYLALPIRQFCTGVTHLENTKISSTFQNVMKTRLDTTSPNLMY